MQRSTTFVVLFQLLLNLHLSDQASGRFRKFSTKTTYKNSVAQDELYYNISQTEWHLEGYKPVLVVGLFRHGIRYPGVSDFKNIAKVIFKMKVAGVTSSVVDPLEAVANKFLIAEDKALAEAGKQELFDLGKRFGMEMAEIMSSESNSSKFGFFTSSKSRSMDSCESFKSGFVEASGLSFDIGTSVDDNLLRFFGECSKYVLTVADNKSAIAEAIKFQRQILPKVNERISEQLGVKRLDLTKDEVKSLHVIAGTELAILGSSTWSLLLSDEDLELLEYAADIKNYWKKGYGFPINYEPSCVLLRHMFEHLENYVSGKTKKKAVFYFGHTETIIPVLSILGLFNDTEPLMADNYERQHQRQFRTTRLSPFASNIAFVLNRWSGRPTDNSPESSTTDQFSVSLLFKERPLILPACGGRFDCPYSVFQKHYTDHQDDCSFTEMCQTEMRTEL